MLENCCKIGIRPAVVTWLAFYLNSRTQVIKCGSEISDKRIVHGGVPQDSKTGPVVFIVQINDLSLVLKQPEVTYSEDMTKCDNDDDDVTIFMDDATISEIIDIKNHIAGEAIGNAERNIGKVRNLQIIRK